MSTLHHTDHTVLVYQLIKTYSISIDKLNLLTQILFIVTKNYTFTDILQNTPTWRIVGVELIPPRQLATEN